MFKMIRQLHLKHGWFYNYKVHMPKTEQLCNNGFDGLKNFLESIFKECPNDYFEQGPRSSQLRIPLDFNIHEVYGHELNEMAKSALELDLFNSSHFNVQMFMLINDNKTISMETPVWMLNNELDNFKKFMMSSEPLTGHIDLLRIENNKIWVLDYKPNAEKQKFASTQVFFYSLMLSKRTGIPLDKFRCCYFDDEAAFMFKPEINALKNR